MFTPDLLEELILGLYILAPAGKVENHGARKPLRIL